MNKHSRSIFSFLLLAIFICFSSCEENGEELNVYARIKGKIKHYDNLSPIQGVYVSTNPISTTVKTDENGEYVLEELTPGEYTITVKKDGFATESGIRTVEKEEIAIVDFLLEEEIIPNSAPTFAMDSLFPEDDAEDLNLYIEFKWSASDDKDDEELLFDILLFKENEIEGTYIAQDIADTTYTHEKLEYNTIYRWQIIAKDTEEGITKSDIFTFKTKPRPENPIFFSQKVDGSYEIFASDTSESNKVQLTSGPYINWNPRKSPVNNQVAYVSNADGDFNIYVMEYGEKTSKKITVIPIAGYHNPGTGFSWSANGGEILYPHYDKIYKVNNNGSGLEVFATAPEGKHFRMVDCSRYNDRVLALTNEIDGFANSIIIYDTEGNALDTILNDQQGTISSACFYIDASKILYCYDNSGLQADDGRQLDVRIYEYDIATGNSTEISTSKDAGTNDYNARYSATGAQIIYENGYNNSEKTDIYIIDHQIDGGNAGGNTGGAGGGSRQKLFDDAILPEW